MCIRSSLRRLTGNVVPSRRSNASLHGRVAERLSDGEVSTCQPRGRRANRHQQDMGARLILRADLCVNRPVQGDLHRHRLTPIFGGSHRSTPCNGASCGCQHSQMLWHNVRVMSHSHSADIGQVPSTPYRLRGEDDHGGNSFSIS